MLFLVVLLRMRRVGEVVEPLKFVFANTRRGLSERFEDRDYKKNRKGCRAVVLYLSCLLFTFAYLF